MIYLCANAMRVCCICRPTLMEAYDVGVPEWGGDLNLSLDVNSVQVVCDALLADRLDSHLRKKTHYWVFSCFRNPKCPNYSYSDHSNDQVWMINNHKHIFIFKQSLSSTARKTALGYRGTLVTLVRLCAILVVVAHFHRLSGASKHRFLFN